MGLDCGIAIMTESGEFKTKSLDRFYVFGYSHHLTMRWMNEEKITQLITESMRDRINEFEKGNENLKHFCYCMHWLNIAIHEVLENPGAEFLIYTDNDDVEDIPKSAASTPTTQPGQ